MFLDLENPDLSIKDLDEDQARRQLGYDYMTLPDDYTYIRGKLRPVGFVGTSGYALRFDAPRSAFDELSGPSIKTDMSEFIDVSCDTPQASTRAHSTSSRPPVLDAEMGGWSQLRSVGYTCTDETSMRVSNWNPESNGYPLPPDPTKLSRYAVILIAEDTKTQVYVHDSGS